MSLGPEFDYEMFANSPNSYTLTEKQKQFYKDYGYLILKEFVDQASLDSYRRRFIQICRGEVPRGSVTVVKEPALKAAGAKGEDAINKVQEILFDEVFSRYTEDPRIIDVVSTFLGENITAVHSMLINKPPGCPRHPAHQDLYYFPFRPADKIIATWTAVDPVTPENGCLFVVPGSHKENTLYEHGHLKDTANKMYHGITQEDQLAPLDRRVNLIMKPGDTVFFHPYLVHGSGANDSKNYRKAMTAHFAASDVYFIDVTGTTQHIIAREFEAEGRRRGLDMSFADFWRYYSKLVKGVKSNL